MPEKFNGMDWTALTLVVIGGINWGLVGFFKFNLVDAVFGALTVVPRVIYALVGLAALYMIVTGVKMSHHSEDEYIINEAAGHRA